MLSCRAVPPPSSLIYENTTLDHLLCNIHSKVVVLREVVVVA